MKKALLLALCCSMIYAEEPASEMQAKDEIENFLVEEPMQEIQLVTPILPITEAPTQEVAPLQEVELNTETPLIPAETLAAPSIPAMQAEPSIVPQVIFDPKEDIAAIQKEEKEVAAEVKSEGI
ncbi:MAG TPA: hypothetical protein PKW79_05320, partial [Rhabdochlamydiaceae bacterium]|nr:hypothetical protein [Rhabdochlamydiaceae bacterium]